MPIIRNYKNYFHLNNRLYTNSESNIQLTKDIFKRLALSNVRKVEDKQRMLTLLLLNLRIAYEAGNCIAYSRDRNYYTDKDFTFANTVPIVDALKALGLINTVRGYNFPDKCAPARLYPTVNLESMLNGMNLSGILEDIPKETILLRNKDKESITFTDTPEIVLMRQNLDIINEVRSKAKIGLAKVPYNLIENDRSTLGRYILEPIISERIDKLGGKSQLVCKALGVRPGYLHRVFNEDFTRGGRFYGGFETAVSRELRPYITINAKPTVEIDYKALHINMLYHLMGIDWDGDPYLDVCQDKKQRKSIKALMLIAINAKDKKSAIKAFRSAMNEAGSKKNVIGRLTDENILRKLEMVENKHPKLVANLYSDKGASLMNLDSKIADEVIISFAKDGIACLCVHDSFIVEGKHKERLKDEMKQTYYKYVGFEPKLG